MSDIGLQDNNLCLGCGAENPIGLKMRVEPRGPEWVSELTVPAHFQGWAGIAHGGFLCTVMDEVMGWALLGAGMRAVTARMSARFLKPVPTGARIVVFARLLRRKGRVLRLESRIELADGVVAADAKGLFIIMSDAAG